MGLNGVMSEPSWLKNTCSFCYEKLGKKELIQRRIKKVYTCPYCHKKVDERFVIN